MKSEDWIELDPKNLPPFGRMLVCNAVQAWTVDMVHAGTKDDWRGRVFAYTDDNRTACDLSHYIPVTMPKKRTTTPEAPQ